MSLGSSIYEVTIMPVINTNISALYAQASMASNSRQINNLMQDLSTGKRINGAADDSAGLSISSRLTSQIRGLNQAIRNSNDAISLIQTAEGATDTITNMLQRMRELTIQAGNGTNGTDDKAALAAEYSALALEINRVAVTTTWGGVAILNGGAAVGSGTAPTAASSKTFTFVADASATASGNISIDIKNMVPGASAGFGITVKDGGTAAQGTLLSTVTTAEATTLVGMLDASINYVNTARSSMGATINRLQYTIDNLTNIATNSAASRSRIEDVDYSLATTELARRNIIQQAATAMLSQANQQPQMVLQLFR